MRFRVNMLHSNNRKEEIMLQYLMKQFGKGMDLFFGFNESDDALTRMFQTEYNNEYRNARKQGVNVDDRFVREFLDIERKH